MKYVFFGLAALTLVSFFVYLHNYWLHYPAHSASFWQYGYQQAAEALGQPEFAQKTVYVENIDRMYLYFLFFNRIPPELVQGKTKAFVAANFERYRFVNVNQHLIDTMNPGEVIMMAAANPLTQQFRAPVKIIADYEGQPLYGIYEKD